MNALTVGVVLKPQGIRGEIKIKPYTDSAEVFLSFKEVYLGGVPYKVLRSRTADGFVYLSLRGVPDRNAAELLRGKEVTLPREEAPVLPEGSYYIADLLGSAVVTEGGETLGVLKDITQGSADVYALEAEGGEVLFAAARGVVVCVNVEKKEIVVNKKRWLEVAVR